MPDHYVPRPWDPMDPAFDGAYCRTCDEQVYVGELNDYGDCPDCNGGEAA